MSQPILSRITKFDKFYADLPASLDIHTSITDRVRQLENEVSACKAMGQAQKEAAAHLYSTCNEQLQGLKTQQSMSPLNLICRIIQDPKPESDDLTDKLNFILSSLDFVFATSLNLSEKLNSVELTMSRCTESLSYLEDMDINFPTISTDWSLEGSDTLHTEEIKAKEGAVAPSKVELAPMTPPTSPPPPKKPQKNVTKTIAPKKK